MNDFAISPPNLAEKAMLKFKRLRIWNEALELSTQINKLRTAFPNTETYVLGTQIQRAADSVVLNIAEGTTLQSEKEFARFLIIANRSAIEVCACLELAKERSLTSEAHAEQLIVSYEKMIVSIQALIRKLRQDGG